MRKGFLRCSLVVTKPKMKPLWHTSPSGAAFAGAEGQKGKLEPQKGEVLKKLIFGRENENQRRIK